MILSAGLASDELRALGFTEPPVERLDLDGMASNGSPPTLPEGDGWILLPHDADPALLHALVHATVSHPGRWTLLLVNGSKLVPLSPGMPVAANFVAERLETAPAVFSLRHAADDIARIRHDLNNPLTAAMAETQLLRMDADQEALEVIETQLRRLRDLIAGLAQWRLPR